MVIFLNEMFWLSIWKYQVNFVVGVIFKRAAKQINKFKHETNHLGKNHNFESF